MSLENFYKLLKPNGLLWIDITPDKVFSQGPEIIEKFSRKINRRDIELLWKTRLSKKNSLRVVEGSFLFNNIQYKHTFYSYYMTSKELTKLLYQAGFKKVQKIAMKNEIYTTLIARK